MIESTTALWQHGIIAPWYLREDQLPIYELLLTSKRPFIECARRYGKTTSILAFVLEELLQNPGQICMWCEPDKNQAREIIKPEIAKIFALAPEYMRPVWSTEDSFYWFPSTGPKDFASKLKLRGINHDRGDSARGPFAHIIVADEFGTWKDPDYIVDEALKPQLQTTSGPFIFASTPPEDLGHAYYTHKDWSIRENRFIQRTIYDNKSLSPERIKELVDDCRGEDTPAWKREYLCLPVSNPERLVIPEYIEDVHDVCDDYPRPDYFVPYVGVDLGFNDCTAMLFGYWDFVSTELVIEDELVVSGKNSKEIVEAAKAIESRIWGKHACISRLKRFGDNELQQLYDMSSMFGYHVTATKKDDKLAAINALRLRFSKAKIKIKKRCKSLRYQLKVGLWNERRTDFSRGEKTGHLDALDALIYLSRNISESENPWPSVLAGKTIYTHQITEIPSSENDTERALLDTFGI